MLTPTLTLQIVNGLHALILNFGGTRELILLTLFTATTQTHKDESDRTIGYHGYTNPTLPTFEELLQHGEIVVGAVRLFLGIIKLLDAPRHDGIKLAVQGIRRCQVVLLGLQLVLVSLEWGYHGNCV